MVNTKSFPILRRVALLSVHTSPLAELGGEKTGGMNVYVRDFSQALAQRGVLVDVFTRLQAIDQQPIALDLGPGVRVIHVPAGPLRALPVDDVRNHVTEFANGVAAFAAAQGIGYDLVHSHYWLSGLVAEELLQRWHGIPLVHMFHTLGYMKNQIAQSERERASSERLAGEHRVVQVADRLIAPTLAECTQLIDYYKADPHKITIIPPGVDLKRFQRVAKAQAQAAVGLSAERTNILFTGRIEPLKGIDTLLHAAALLRARRPEQMAQTKVTIIGGDLRTVGRDTELTRLHALRCDLNLCDLVSFVGAKNQDILPTYFAAADMVVMPSHYESFGMVALEAMATGTPVIASAVGGLAHLVRHGETGLTMPPRDPAALAERMDELLVDVGRRDQLGRQASLYARQFEWPGIVRRMIDEVYQPLLLSRFRA